MPWFFVLWTVRRTVRRKIHGKSEYNRNLNLNVTKPEKYMCAFVDVRIK